MADEKTPEEINPETETTVGEPEAPVAAETPAADATEPGPISLPGLGETDKDEPSAQAAIEPEADKPAEQASDAAEPTLPGIEPATPETTPEAEPAPATEPAAEDKPAEPGLPPVDVSTPSDEPPAAEPKPDVEPATEPAKDDEPATDAGKPGAVTPQPELTGDAGGSSDAPATDVPVKTEGDEPVTQDALGDDVKVICVGDPAMGQGNYNKVLQVGDEHQAVGIDDQVLAAAGASAAARGVLWEAFCQIAGILGGTAFDLHRHVKKHHKGASKAESEWQAIVDGFLRDSAAS